MNIFVDLIVWHPANVPSDYQSEWKVFCVLYGNKGDKRTAGSTPPRNLPLAEAPWWRSMSTLRNAIKSGRLRAKWIQTFFISMKFNTKLERFFVEIVLTKNWSHFKCNFYKTRQIEINRDCQCQSQIWLFLCFEERFGDGRKMDNKGCQW